jgi:hypothetical protein
MTVMTYSSFCAYKNPQNHIFDLKNPKIGSMLIRSSSPTKKSTLTRYR